MTTTKTYPMPDKEWLVQQLSTGFPLLDAGPPPKPAEYYAQRLVERFTDLPSVDFLTVFLRACLLNAQWARPLAEHIWRNWVGHCEGKVWLESRGKAL